MLVDLGNETIDEKLERALTLHTEKRFGEAEPLYKDILSANPNDADANWNYGRLLHETNRLKSAAERYTTVVMAPGECPEVKAHSLNNLGIILQKWGHVDKAEQSFKYAVQLWPKHKDALVNWGVCRRHSGDFKAAGDIQRKVLQMDSSKVEAHCETAFLALTTGDLLRGFQKYEWRWKWNNFATRKFITKKPKWNGQKLDGKTIMLTHEQGLGDTIQFIRYAKMVKARGATVHCWVPPELVSLVGTVEGVDKVFCAHDQHDEYYDFHCPMLSLPRIFKTRLDTIPNGVPYIKVDAQYAPQVGTKRIGIAWAGRPEHGNDRFRSMKIEQFETLFDIPDTQWFSFQFGPRSAEADAYPQVTRLDGKIKDFTDTAKLLHEVDLLIAVDTSIVHLAGAMGRPCWTLLPFSPDWRWMLERPDSPWYPSMKLWRQETKGDWAGVIERVKTALTREASLTPWAQSL